MRGRHIRRAFCCREIGDNIIRDQVMMLQEELNLLCSQRSECEYFDAIPFVTSAALIRPFKPFPGSETSDLSYSLQSRRLHFCHSFHLLPATSPRESTATSRDYT